MGLLNGLLDGGVVCKQVPDNRFHLRHKCYGVRSVPGDITDNQPDGMLCINNGVPVAAHANRLYSGPIRNGDFKTVDIWWSGQERSLEMLQYFSFPVADTSSVQTTRDEIDCGHR